MEQSCIISIFINIPFFCCNALFCHTSSQSCSARVVSVHHYHSWLMLSEKLVQPQLIYLLYWLRAHTQTMRSLGFLRARSRYWPEKKRRLHGSSWSTPPGGTWPSLLYKANQLRLIGHWLGLWRSLCSHARPVADPPCRQTEAARKTKKEPIEANSHD